MQMTKKETILFVDDEESILDIVTEYFEMKAYRILTAENGRKAVDILSREKIDCCFTDINMPEMDGLDLAEYIRNYDNTIPVIIMTGFPSMENTLRTLKNGVVDFLIKPVNLSQLEITVRRVLRERKLLIRNIFLTKEIEKKRKLQKLNRELLCKVDELNILNRIILDFTSANSSVDLFKKVVDITTEVTQADDARFFIVNEKLKKPIEVAASVHESSRQFFEEDGRWVDLCGTGLEKIIIDNMDDCNPLLIQENKMEITGLDENILSFMCIPLTIRKKAFGVLVSTIVSGDARFNEKDLYYLSFMSNKASYAIENIALYENIYDNLFATLYAFVKAIEARDPYTLQHSNRVTDIALAIGKEMGAGAEDQDILNVAGRLHDIGKIGIRDDILLKPGPLADAEFRIIREHPIIGAGIVERLGLWDREKLIIKCHHERFDGNGYPNGLKGQEIPMLARILSVSDVYDALASDRAYRKRLEDDQVLAIMDEGAGGQFDPEVINTFQQLNDKGAFREMASTF